MWVVRQLIDIARKARRAITLYLSGTVGFNPLLTSPLPLAFDVATSLSYACFLFHSQAGRVVGLNLFRPLLNVCIVVEYKFLAFKAHDVVALPFFQSRCHLTDLLHPEENSVIDFNTVSAWFQYLYIVVA